MGSRSCGRSASPIQGPSSFVRTEFTEDQLDRIKSLIKFHFDIEILQKQYESRFLYWELERRKSFLEDLKQLLYYDRLLQQSSSVGDLEKTLNQPILESVASPAPLTTQSAPTSPINSLIRTSRRSNIIQHGTPGRNKMSPEQVYQYERRSDGVIVKLVCPECGRDTFGNVLGVTNHCRIVHGLQFFTSEERMAKCGIPLTEEQALLEIPKSYYDANLRNIYSILSPTVAATGPNSLESGNPIQGQKEGGTAAALAAISESRFYVKKSIHITDFSIRTSRPIEQSSSKEEKFKEEPSEEEDYEQYDSEEIESDFSAQGTSRRRRKRRWTPKPAPKSKKPYIPSESDFPFVWQLVVSGPPESHDIRSFIHKARFILHPTHAPKHLIEVTQAPFAIRVGAYSESLVKVNLYLKYLTDDSEKQEVDELLKPLVLFSHKVSFFHPIKNLSLTAKPHVFGTTPIWSKGNETVHKVELEKESSRDLNRSFDQNVSKIIFESALEELPRVRYLTLEDLSEDDREDVVKSLAVESIQSEIEDLDIFKSKNGTEKEQDNLKIMEDSFKAGVSTVEDLNQYPSSSIFGPNKSLTSSATSAYYIPKRTNMKQYIASRISKSDGLSPVSISSIVPPSKNLPSSNYSSSSLPEYKYTFGRSGTFTASLFSYSSFPFLFNSSSIYSPLNPNEFHLDRLLNRFVLYYPLVISSRLNPESSWSEAELHFIPKATYSPSTCVSSFLKLSDCKRWSREWQRAKLVKNLISLVIFLEDPLLDNIAEKSDYDSLGVGPLTQIKSSDKSSIRIPSTLSILLWCRQNRFTPLSNIDPDLTEKSILASEAMWKANYTPIVTILSKVQVNVEDATVTPMTEPSSPLLQLQSSDLSSVNSFGTAFVDPTADEEANLIQGMEVLNDLDSNFVSSLYFCRFCGKVQIDKGFLTADKKSIEKQKAMSPQERYQQFLETAWMAHGRKCSSKPIRGKLSSILSGEIEDMDGIVDSSAASVDRFHRIIASGYRDPRYLDWLSRKYRVPRLLLSQKISSQQSLLFVDPLWIWSVLVSIPSRDFNGTLLPSRLHTLRPQSSTVLFISLALERFLAHMLSYVVYLARSQSSSSGTLIASQGQLSLALSRSGKYVKCLTPVHIFKAIYTVKEFSFLREDLEQMD